MFIILLFIIPRLQKLKSKPAKRKKLQLFNRLKGKGACIELFLPSRPNKEMTTVKLTEKYDVYLPLLT